MYNVSSLFLEKIKQDSRTIDIKVVIGDRILNTTEVQSLNVECTLGNSGIPAIGGVASTKLTIDLLRIGNTPSYFTTQTIKPSIAIDDGVGNLMWVPLGTFYPNPDSIKRTDNKISIECFDIIESYSNVQYESSLKYPQTITAVINELKSKYGVVFKSASYPGVNIKELPTRSIRDVLRIISELSSTNCIVNRDGEIEFKSFNKVVFSLDTNNYIDFKLKSDSNVKITRLTSKKGEESFTVGNDEGAALEFENSSITSNAELKAIYDRMFPFIYPSYELKVQGMPHLECGDIISLTDKKGIVRDIPITTHKISFNGGLISNISANVTSSSNSIGSTGSGSISQTANTALVNSIKANEILAGNITADNIFGNTITADKLNAEDITTNYLQAEVINAINASIGSATIDSAKIDVAEIATIVAQDLVVGNAQITDLEAEKIKTGDLIADVMKANVVNAVNAYIGEAVIDSAKIGQLTADKIQAIVIDAINANIGSATIDSAKIGDLSAKKIITDDLIADVMTTNVINAVNAYIGEAVIDSAKIGNLSANKITADDISADRMKVNAITAINANVGSATIDSAKIGDLSAKKITSDFLSADMIETGSLSSDKINANDINAIKISASEITANKIAAGEIKVGDINIVDAGISFANISNVNITNAMIDKSFTADAYIENLDASKISTGKLDANKVEVASMNGKLSIKENTITIKDNQSTPKTRVQIGLDARGNYGIYVLNSKGEAIFDSDKGVLLPEGLSKDVVTSEKILKESIDSSKLNIDELFVGENAFINSLKVVELDASQIKTGTISGEHIDITGLVSFKAFNDDIKQVFDVTGEKTYINGGMIATNTIKANSIDLLSGLTVKNEKGENTLAVSNKGTVEINGLLSSSNFDESKNTGYKIDTDGTAIFNQAKVKGDVELPNAGMTNYGAVIGNENIFNISMKNIYTPYHSCKLIDKYSMEFTRVGSVGYLVFAMNDYIPTNEVFTISGYMYINGEPIKDTSYFINKMANTQNPSTSKISLSVYEDGYFKITEKWNGSSRFLMHTQIKGTEVEGTKIIVRNVKFESGQNATPWCPSKSEQFDYTRLWAGASFENRDSAPFRVTQKGDVYAKNGTYEGVLRGTLDSGDVQVYDNAITVHSPGTEDEIISIKANECILNTDVILGDGSIAYSKGTKLIRLTETDFIASGVQSDVSFNKEGGTHGGLNIIGKTGGHHILRGSTSSAKAGTLFFDSEGGQGTDGDFSFIRKNGSEKVKVKVDGDLTVHEKINSSVQKIEMRSVKSDSWDGWGFYAN